MRIRRERKHQYGNSNIRRMILQCAVPNQPMHKHLCLTQIKKLDSSNILWNSSHLDVNQTKENTLIQTFTKKNMNSIIKRAVKREKLKTSEINKLTWEEDFKRDFIFNKKFNEIWHRNMINNSINRRSKKSRKAKNSRKSKNFVIKKQHKCKPKKKKTGKDIDFQKIKKFRKDLLKKYEWRTDFHKIFMEWDISKTGHVKVSDFVKMAKEVGYTLTHNESALIVALEDESDKGYLIPSELLRLIYNKGIEVPANLETNHNGDPATKKSKNDFQEIKSNILQMTHDIRTKTKT